MTSREFTCAAGPDQACIDPASTEVIEFDLGNVAAFDPQPEASNGGSGDLITQITSWWHTRRCTICGHTFRRGDRVRVDSDQRSVGHLDAALSCVNNGAAGSNDNTNDTDSTEIGEFIAGLLSTWPVVGDLPVVRTDDEPYLLAAPAGGFHRRSCLVCAHSFRRDELVIVCPCRPRERHCRAAVHRDPGQGLVCWENWRPGSTVHVCPVMLARLDP